MIPLSVIYCFLVSPPPLFFPFHVSFLSFPCWTFSLFSGALQSAAWGAISLTPLQPYFREQFGHRGENDATVFSPGDAHRQIPRHHQYVFYQRDDIIARGETTRFCTHPQASGLSVHMILSSPGRGGQWLSPFLHSGGVCNGPSSCSCSGW